MKPIFKTLVVLPFALGAIAVASHLRTSGSLGVTVTGKGIEGSALGEGLGSLPTALLETPEGRWAIVAATGRRQQLTTVDRKSGHVASVLPILTGNAIYGPMAADVNGHVYVARGFQDALSVFKLDAAGHLLEEAEIPVAQKLAPAGWPRFAAGVAVDPSGHWAYVTLNATSAYTEFKGGVAIIDLSSRKPMSILETKGFPMAVVWDQNRLFVASERDDCVEVFDATSPTELRRIRTIFVGKHPGALTIDKELGRLYVANINSDTLSVIDTQRLTLAKTVLLRPVQALTLPGATPSSVAIDRERDELHIPLSDMNAVAILSRKSLKLNGLAPTANYPTVSTTSADGSILVACARGNRPRIPNNTASGPKGEWGREVLAVQEGTLESLPRQTASLLKAEAPRVVAANSLGTDFRNRADATYDQLHALGVKHVMYVVKENRTYDQVFGDMKEGNGDPSLTDFGADITPNHHALAKRFALWDNFYCCADVSADGWTWSVAGMVPNYNARNTPVLYSNRGRAYDFEGQNNGTAVEYIGLNDVAQAPGGYLWDLCIAKHLSFRNYGFYISTADEDEKGPDGKYLNEAGRAAVKALDKYTDRDFGFGMEYADSDLWRMYHCASPKQLLKFGKYGSSSRMAEWLREFHKYEATDTFPALQFLTLQRDHTAGTSPGLHTPKAMVADNDYALGLLVQTISHSKYWKDTAIVVVEDDASNGYDHVDCHRSICLVISPLVPKGTVEHRFGNTVSAVRTIEALLGLPAMNQYDRFAMPAAFLTKNAGNDAPYSAIKPSTEIASAINTMASYRSGEFSAEDFHRPDAVDEDDLRDIVRHAK